MRKILALVALISLSFIQFTQAQDLKSERIRKISPRKRSIYFSKGIFHNGGVKLNSSLQNVRHSYSAQNGYERFVFDFETKEVPRIYGYISDNEKKLYLDFFETNMIKEIAKIGKSKYVKSLNFFPLTKENLSIEVEFKEGVSVDIFHLSNPGRFVIDIKK